MSRKRVLITGGAGFIGSSLAETLLERAYDVVVIDNLSTGSKKNLITRSNYRFIKCDVNVYEDISPVFTTYAFDYVFHFAAVVGVKRTLENPVSVLKDINGIRNVLDLCKNTGVKRLFYSSSSEVYGEPVELPQNELTTPLNSRLPYAIIKNVGEAFCKSYQIEFGLPYTIFRFFNTYGPRQSSDFVVSKFLQSALQGKSLTIYGDGNQQRTFCYISDNVECMIKVLENDYMINDVLNIGNDISYTIKELASVIIEETSSASTIEYLPPLKEGDMSRRQPDLIKMRRIMNKEFIDLRNGVRMILADMNK